jgi:uncharacterized protein (UPF0216 family)
MKVSDKAKTDQLFEILQNKNIPNLLLKIVIEIYSENEIKVKINNKLSEENTINYGVNITMPFITSTIPTFMS